MSSTSCELESKSDDENKNKNKRRYDVFHHLFLRRVEYSYTRQCRRPCLARQNVISSENIYLLQRTQEAPVHERVLDHQVVAWDAAGRARLCMVPVYRYAGSCPVDWIGRKYEYEQGNNQWPVRLGDHDILAFSAEATSEVFRVKSPGTQG